MVSSTRYTIKAEFTTPANDVTLDSIGQTAHLRAVGPNALRVALLPSQESASGRCLAAYAWDPCALTVEVNGVVYRRAPVPLLHNDTIVLRVTTGGNEGAVEERHFRVAVTTTDTGVLSDVSVETPQSERGVSLSPGAQFPMTCMRQQSSVVTEPSAAVDRRQLSTSSGVADPQHVAAENAAVWHNYYWYRYNVPPDAIGLATREPLPPARAVDGQGSVHGDWSAQPSDGMTELVAPAEWAIKALLQRHRISPSGGNVTHHTANLPSTASDTIPHSSPPCFFVSHIAVNAQACEEDHDQTGLVTSPPRVTTSAQCCGVCPLQRELRRGRGYLASAAAHELSETERAAQRIVSQLRTVSQDDGLCLPSLSPMVPAEAHGAAHAQDDCGGPDGGATSPAAVPLAVSSDPVAAVSPWALYTEERARIAAEREQQALERERKRLEKNGESTSRLIHAEDEGTAERVNELQRVIQRIYALEYILGGPHYTF